MENLEMLVAHIQETHKYFYDYAARQVNNLFTMRNWLVGMYLYEYEQNGLDRAVYGERLYRNLAVRLKERQVKGMSFTFLHTCKQFYVAYPQIVQTLSEQFPTLENPLLKKGLFSHEQMKTGQNKNDGLAISVQNPSLFLSKVSFSHILEFIKIDEHLKRSFYEIQTIKNNWTVKQLQREINSLLYERIGLSTDKEAMLQKLTNDSLQQVSDIIKNPYILEFLGIEEKSEYTETDLEQAIISHLHRFLIELGRGFCFEARQKRISFNNRHYKIDLVFYHRILKCHLLIDLKLGEFDHADAGQMNVYLNYYSQNEMAENDNPPIGLILCSQKDNALVHYATGGLPQEIFVSKYKLQLPSEKELIELIENDVQLFKNK